jgi:integrase
MPKNKLPGYRLHKGTGQGYTEYQRKAYYFGAYGSPESRQKFARFISQLTAIAAPAAAVLLPGSVPLVAELVDSFLDHAATRYVKDGRPTSELTGYRAAVAPVVRLYGAATPSEFGPLALDAVRREWLAQGLARKTINQYVGRVVRVWKWGVGRQVVPVAAWQALTSLESLRSGQGVTYPKIKAVSESRVNPIQPFVSRQVWAMIQYQLWTGCRPHEACQVRLSDIDRTHEIWEHRPGRFKTQHHEDSQRIIYLGPHAQRLVLEWERANPAEWLWQPRDARREWLVAHGSKRAGRGTHQAGEQYTANSYGRAVEHGCERAFGMPGEFKRGAAVRSKDDPAGIKASAAEWRRRHCWSPNQLRHTAATRIRATYGLEVARIILGHTSAVTTEIYAEQDKSPARQAARESG